MSADAAPDAPAACTALLCDGPGQAQLGEVQLPSRLAGGGLGRVLAAGVCGSDLALFQGGLLAERVWPVILGHETVVRVEAASEVLTRRWGVHRGDRVFVEEFVPCGWCRECRTGHHQLCPRTDFHSAAFLRYGRTSVRTAPGLWGGFAEWMYLHPRAQLHPVPPGVASSLAVLATPLANGLRWVAGVARAAPGECVVVLGPGAHGLGCVVAAREVGAGPVVLVGTAGDQLRLRIGSELGADAVLRSDLDDVEAAVRRLTGGRGAQVVVEVTGAAAAAETAVRVAGRHARVVLAGGSAAPAAAFPAGLITKRELTVTGVRGHDADGLAAALRLLARDRYPFASMTTAPVPLTAAAALLSELSSGQDPSGTRAPHHCVRPADVPA